MKTWKPDTCDCHVEEIYDLTGIKSMGQVLTKCIVHQTVADADLYDVLLNKENRVKNRVYRILLGYEEIKDLGLEEPKKNQDGTDAGPGLKVGIEYAWNFVGTGANRVLQAEIKGSALTKAKKDELKALCDTKFGLGKVEVI
jgi:hypothetical protein